MAKKKPERIPIPLIDGDSERSSKSKRLALAQKLGNWIIASNQNTSALRDKWRETARYVRNEQTEVQIESTNAESDQAPVNIPYTSIRVDNLCALIEQVVLSQDPPMVPDTGVQDEDMGDALQRILQVAWEEGGFQMALADATFFAAITNKAIYRLGFTTKGKGFEGDSSAGKGNFGGSIKWAGVTIDAIDPADFVIAPSEPKLEDATMVGRRFYMSASEVAERIILKDYFDVPMQSSSPAKEETIKDVASMGESVLSEEETLGGREDALQDPIVFDGYEELSRVELYELYVKLSPTPGSLRQMYKVILCPAYNALLKMEVWPFSRAPFFDGRIKFDPTCKSFFEGRSVTRDLMPINDMFNKTWTLFWNGAVISSTSNFIGPDSIGEKNLYVSEGGGSIITVPDDGTEGNLKDRLIPLENTFEGQALADSLSQLERYGDVVAGTTANSLGAPDSKEVTATQTQAITQGMSTMLNNAIKWLTEPFPEMARFTLELLAHPPHWRLWGALWGFSDVPRDVLLHPTRWTVAGQSMADNPAVRFGMLGQLAKFAQDPSLGWDRRKLGKMILANCGLQGAQSIALPDAEYQAQMQQLAQAQAQTQQGDTPPDDGDTGPSGPMGQPSKPGGPPRPHPGGVGPPHAGVPGMAASPQGTTAGSTLTGLPLTNQGGGPKPGQPA